MANTAIWLKNFHGKTDLVAYGLISLASQVDCIISSVDGGLVFMALKPSQDWAITTIHYHSALYGKWTCWFERWQSSLGTLILGSQVLPSDLFGDFKLPFQGLSDLHLGYQKVTWKKLVHNFWKSTRQHHEFLGFVSWFVDIILWDYSLFGGHICLRTLSKKPMEGVNSLVVHLPPSNFSSIQSTHWHQNHEKFPGN